jgi:uncharacterized protein (TIGR02996 family)
MNSENALLRAALESPEDEAPWQVYADWLEEQGDPRATVCRKHPEIGRLLAGLCTSEQAPFDEIETYATAGLVAVLSALAVTLRRCGPLVHNQKFPGIASCTLDHVEKLLALTPGGLSVETVVSRRWEWTEAQGRTFASVLASGQPDEALLALFAQDQVDGPFVELLACLVQELTLRRGSLAELPPVVRFAERLRAKGHALADLPPTLLDIEGGLKDYLPHYDYRGSSWSGLLGQANELEQPLPTAAEEGPLVFTEWLDDLSTRQISAAVSSWHGQSNGMIEARVFRSARPLGEADLSVALLRSLGLQALAGAAEGGIRAGRVQSKQGLNILFTAAATGGACAGSLLGAYGRLEAWHSMAGLVGASAGESVKALATLAERCLWVSFTAASAWYYHVCWDVGLLAVRPDRMSVAVLAATDTD